MRKGYKYGLILFVVVALGAYLSRTLGWYGDYWFTDVILHTISGVMFGLFWLGFMARETFRSKWTLAISTVTFAVFWSFLWEMWELWGSILAPWFPTKYVPELADSLWDMTCGAIGGAIAYAGSGTSRSGSRRA